MALDGKECECTILTVLNSLTNTILYHDFAPRCQAVKNKNMKYKPMVERSGFYMVLK